MSKFIRHFLEEELGAGLLSDYGFSRVLWSISTDAVIAQGGSLTYGDRVLSATSDAPPFSGSPTVRSRGGIMITDAIGQNPKSLRTSLELGTFAPFRINPSVGLRASGNSYNYSGYFLDVQDSSNFIHIKKAIAGAFGPSEVTLSSLAFAFDSQPQNKTIHILFEAVDQSGGSPSPSVNLRAKVWQNAETEPTSYTIQADDVGILLSTGDAFVGCVRDSGLSETNGAVWFVSVGTGSDSAPAPPKTWTEYLDFLDTQDVLRCMLLEQNVVCDFGSPSSAVAGKLCISNYPFISGPESRFPNVCYEEILKGAPQIRRKLADGFTGIMSIAYGDAKIKNETTNSDAPILGESFSGRLDNWLAYNVDGRRTRLLYGSPTWRRCDFKPYWCGVATGLYRSGPGELSLKIRGQEAMFDMALSTGLVGGTGPNKDSIAPVGMGYYFNVEPVLYDAALFKYCLERTGFGLSTFDSWTNNLKRTVYDGGVELNVYPVYFSANVGTAIINTSAAHNLQVGMELVWDTNGGAFVLPNPVNAGQTYYVTRVPTASTFAMTDTPGSPTGAEIIYTTSPAAGALLTGRPYSYDTSLGVGLLQMLNRPAGILTAYNAPAAVIVVTSTLVSCVANAISMAYSVSLRGVAPGATTPSYRASVTTASLGVRWKQQVSLGDSIAQMCRSVGASFIMSRFGTYFLARLNVPTGTARWTVGADDIRNWRTGDRNLPRKVERLGYKRNYTQMKGGDLLGLAAQNLNTVDLLGKPYTLATYAPSESGLDQPDNHTMVVDPAERATDIVDGTEAATEVQRIYTLYRKQTGTFLFDTDAWALACEIGDEISVTYPKDGFAAGKNASIVGITEDAMRGSVTLEIFAQSDGLFPILTDTSQPIVSGNYY